MKPSSRLHPIPSPHKQIPKAKHSLRCPVTLIIAVVVVGAMS
jgi:hypothetical protein